MSNSQDKAVLRAKAKVKHYEMLVRIGDTAGAARYAERAKLDLTPADVTFVPTQPVPSARRVVVSKPKPPAPVIVPPPPPPPLCNGWPTLVEAEIVRRCRNPRLSAIVLPDGRQASVWNGKSGYATGARVKVKLESAQGDPLYEIVGAADSHGPGVI